MVNSTELSFAALPGRLIKNKEYEMLGEIIIYNYKEKRNATAKEITDLIDNEGLIINYYNKHSNEQGNVWLDIMPPYDSIYELRSYDIVRDLKI